MGNNCACQCPCPDGTEKSPPEEAKKAFTFPTMHNKVLLSLGTFCDNGYKVVLTKNKIFICYENNKYKSLQGDRDGTTGM